MVELIRHKKAKCVFCGRIHTVEKGRMVLHFNSQERETCDGSNWKIAKERIFR